MGKRSPAPPPAPDYTTLAIKQGEANLAAAKQSAYMSNPNVYGPTGSQTVEWTKSRTTDTDAYNKAMQAYQQQLFLDPNTAGAPPQESQFQTEIEQPTITQTIDPNALAALRAQELTQRRMSEAAAGAAGGLGNLGIASAFNAGGIPGIRYDAGYAGPIERYFTAGQEVPGYTDFNFAVSDMQFAPGAGGYAPTAGYGIEGLPGQIGAGQQAGGGPAAPGVSQFQYGGPQTAIGETGFSQAGSSFIGIPRAYGADFSGVGGVGQGTGAGQFGYAGGGPFGGLFGMAGGGPQGMQFGGLDTAGLMGVQGGVGQFGQAQGGGVAGPQLRGLDTSGLGGPQAAPGQGQFGYAQQFVQGPELQGQIDVAGLAAAPIGAGTTAQQAIMSRLGPQLQGERQQLYTQLINQGLRPGGEAFNAAMSAQAQKENDLVLQAAAQGIALDQAARQQGFAEQQSRAMFANQAQLQGFGAGMEQAGLYNVGLGQNVQQALATQAAANQAQQQAFQQRLAGAEFGQEAELARFGAGMQTEQARNQAIAQNTQMALQSGQFANEAQAQQFSQRLAAGEFGREAQLASFQTGQAAQEAVNRAIAQNFAQAQSAQQLQNQAIQQNLQGTLGAEEAQRAAQAQRFGQAATQAELAAQFGGQQFAEQAQLQQIINAAAGQNFQQALQSREGFNAAQQQAYQQALQQQGFNREALLAQFGMGQQAQQLQNAAAAQNFGQAAQAQELNLARQAQQAGQAGQQAQFYNQAQAQAYQQQLAQQAAQNAAQGQRFGQVVTQQEARNAALAQRFGQDAQRAALQNAAQQQQFQQNMAQQQFYNTAVQQALAQQAAIRSIPVNEISALLSGGQVSIPQFQGYQGVTIAPAPIFQGGQAQDAAAMQRYGIQANQAASNASGLFGALGNLGSAAITAGMFSDRRLKSNIVRVGTHPRGIGIYEYDIFGKRQRGVMADEVEGVLPEAVITHPSGYKMVNYGAL